MPHPFFYGTMQLEDIMKNWFTADEHYFHENARLGWGNPDKARPFTSALDMKEGLIARHNEVVQPEDIVWHVGDMFWRTCSYEEAFNVLSRLNGIHHYVLGNHEEVLQSQYRLRGFFASFTERRYIKTDGGPKHGIVLDHFSGRVWNKSAQGAWQLYGHSHNELESREDSKSLLSCDVGVDSWDCYPVSLEQIAEVMRVKKENRDGNTGDNRKG